MKTIYSIAWVSALSAGLMVSGCKPSGSGGASEGAGASQTSTSNSAISEVKETAAGAVDQGVKEVKELGREVQKGTESALQSGVDSAAKMVDNAKSAVKKEVAEMTDEAKKLGAEVKQKAEGAVDSAAEMAKKAAPEMPAFPEVGALSEKQFTAFQTHINQLIQEKKVDEVLKSLQSVLSKKLTDDQKKSLTDIQAKVQKLVSEQGGNVEALKGFLAPTKR